jgi:hypothetical protein
METETQKPENQKHNENGPKHRSSLYLFTFILVSHPSAQVEELEAISRIPGSIVRIAA